MSWPDPKPGQVIRYSYLWSSEAERGREEGIKDRPCAIVVVVADKGGRSRVFALPVTHVRPENPDFAVEIPPDTKRRLGLDDLPSWIVVTEWNDFLWPGPDLRPLPNRGAESVLVGYLPPALFERLRLKFLSLARERLASRVGRTE